MRIGTEPPEWAAKTMDHWINIKDGDLNVFVSITDTIDNQVRFIGMTEFSVRESLEGRSTSGIFCAFIEEQEIALIASPEGLEKWTEEEVAANRAAEATITRGETCDKQE